MGIEQTVYAHALRTMGPDRSITTVLCILEILEKIENPGGYLMRFIQKDAEGMLDINQLLKSIRRA
jgi:hypothetical protein